MARQPLTLGVAGASGRMGLAVGAQAEARDDFVVTARFGRDEQAGQSDNGAILVTAAEAVETCRVIIDFSTAEASATLAEAAAAQGGVAW